MTLSRQHRMRGASRRLKIAMSVSLAILVSQCLPLDTFAQHAPQSQTAARSGDERVRKILEGLEPDNALRLALERGDRGDGLHYVWMDRMKLHGIKQVSFSVYFNWGKRGKKLRVVDARYLRQYYRFDTSFDDRPTIEQIRANGLEHELSDEILRRAKANLAQRLNSLRSSQSCGTLYLNLLDDEILPILDEPPDIDEDCKFPNHARRFRPGAVVLDRGRRPAYLSPS